MEFSKKHGLCKAIHDMYPAMPVDGYGTNALSAEMLEQFKKVNLSQGYPFGIENYQKRYYELSQHKCSIRLKWAMEHWTKPPVNQSKELTEFYKAWHQWAINEGINDALAEE